MSDQPYKKPPITEAVIEIRLASPIEAPTINKVNADLAPLYPREENIANFAVTLDLPPPETQRDPVPHMRDRQFGKKRTTTDQSEIILVWPTSFVVSQLAPYPGWTSFFSRFLRDWGMLKRAAGYRRIIRVGVRYINRLDVPAVVQEGSQNNIPTVEESHYLNIYQKSPDFFGPSLAYGLQAQFIPDSDGCRLILNSGSVPSPMLTHVSVALDIDISHESPPQNDDQVFALLELMRAKKNKAFEECVTDRARELFRK